MNTTIYISNYTTEPFEIRVAADKSDLFRGRPIVISPGCRQDIMCIKSHARVCYVIVAYEETVPDEDGRAIKRYGIAWDAREVPHRTDINLQDRHRVNPHRFMSDVEWHNIGG